MKELEELITTTNAANWIPSEDWADLILEASVCYGQLSGIISAMEYDMQAHNGDTVKVRYVPAQTAQGPISACGCLSVASPTLGAHSIDVAAYGDYVDLCDFTLWQAKPRLKEMVFREMAKGLAKKRDEDMWAAIRSPGVAPTYVSSTSVACSASSDWVSPGCCNYAYNLYNSIISVQKDMEGGAKNPDMVIMHPSVAKWLYYKDGTYPPGWNIRTNGDGSLAYIGPMKVIESCNATSCDGTGDATMAVIIDSSRAIGEVWGKRPTFETERVADCAKDKGVVWMYWGTDSMDNAAIGHVRNP